MLVPDIPLEETYEVSEIASKHGIELVLLSTPTTPVERAKKIALATKGFVYLVSVTGVTGVQTNVATRVEQLVEELRSVTDKPIAVGFGVSEAKHAKQIVDWGADGVIVGSALVRALGEADTPEKGLAALKAKAEDLRAGAARAPALPVPAGRQPHRPVLPLRAGGRLRPCLGRAHGRRGRVRPPQRGERARALARGADAARRVPEGAVSLRAPPRA